MIPDWSIGICGLLGFVLAWLLGSFYIAKWKIWAYSKVRNINELKRKAIESNLMWPEESWFNKSMFSTKSQKEKLKKIEIRFKEKDVFKEISTIPSEITFNYKPFKTIDIIMFSLFLGGGFFMIFQEEYLYGFGSLGFFVFIILIQIFRKTEYRKVKLNNKGITLDDHHFIPWNEINDELVIVEGMGKTISNYFQFLIEEVEIKIDLVQFNITPKKLEEALKTYRIRFNKSNPT